MRTFKLFLVLGLFLSLAVPAFCMPMEDAVRMEFMAQPRGRTVTTGNSVVMTLTYNDGTNSTITYAQVGASDSSTILNLYEVGTIVASTRFSSSDGSIDLTSTSYDTLGELVDAISADTSGYWTATLGRDVHRDVSSRYIKSVGKVNANVATSNPATLYLDTDYSRMYAIGVKGEDTAYVRIKFVEESTTASFAPHWLEIYSDETCIYRRGFTSAQSCTRGQSTEILNGVLGTDTATPNTINFAKEYSKGIAGTVGANVVVLSRWNADATMYGNATTYVTSNLSIIYDIAKP